MIGVSEPLEERFFRQEKEALVQFLVQLKLYYPPLPSAIRKEIMKLKRKKREGTHTARMCYTDRAPEL